MTVGLIILMFLLGIFLFINLSPQLGGKACGESLDKVKTSNNFNRDKFVNVEKKPMTESMSFKVMLEYFKKGETVPKRDIPVEKRIIDSQDKESRTKVTWFGHSTLLVEIEGKKLLLDPMLGKVPAPLPVLGTKRFADKLPMEIDEITELDAILVSHDHYDHLDYSTVIKLKDRTKMFYVPLGVGGHLQVWGVAKEKIVELDWWEEAKADGITFVATPSHHFSGRGVFDRDSTLWSSWVIKAKESNLFFSGDTGYHRDFKEIGDKYGPFDLTMLECGQYNESWSNIHMMPEETVQAHIDLRGKALLPIHWATFKLSVHKWNEPIERVTKQASELNVKVVTPKIGEVINVNEPQSFIEWWK